MDTKSYGCVTGLFHDDYQKQTGKQESCGVWLHSHPPNHPELRGNACLGIAQLTSVSTH